MVPSTCSRVGTSAFSSWKTVRWGVARNMLVAWNHPPGPAARVGEARAGTRCQAEGGENATARVTSPAYVVVGGGRPPSPAGRAGVESARGLRAGLPGGAPQQGSGDGVAGGRWEVSGRADPEDPGEASARPDVHPGRCRGGPRPPPAAGCPAAPAMQGVAPEYGRRCARGAGHGDPTPPSGNAPRSGRRAPEYEGRLGRAEVERGAVLGPLPGRAESGGARDHDRHPPGVRRRGGGRPEHRGAPRRCCRGLAHRRRPVPRGFRGRAFGLEPGFGAKKEHDREPPRYRGRHRRCRGAAVREGGLEGLRRRAVSGPPRARSPTTTRSARGFTPHARTGRFPRHELPPRWGRPGGTLARYRLIRRRFQTRAGSARTSSGRIATTEPS
jgi:hypothetical protein